MNIPLFIADMEPLEYVETFREWDDSDRYDIYKKLLKKYVPLANFVLLTEPCLTIEFIKTSQKKKTLVFDIDETLLFAYKISLEYDGVVDPARGR